MHARHWDFEQATLLDEPICKRINSYPFISQRAVSPFTLVVDSIIRRQYMSSASFVLSLKYILHQLHHQRLICYIEAYTRYGDTG